MLTTFQVNREVRLILTHQNIEQGMSNGEVNVAHSLPFDILRFLARYSTVQTTPCHSFSIPYHGNGDIDPIEFNV